MLSHVQANTLSALYHIHGFQDALSLPPMTQQISGSESPNTLSHNFLVVLTPSEDIKVFNIQYKRFEPQSKHKF